jgi:hypothetical protein
VPTDPFPTRTATLGGLPCGCKVAREKDAKLRVFFCSPHAVAYELLEAAQAGLRVLDTLVRTPRSGYDVTAATEAATKVRTAVQSATKTWF